MLRLAGGSARAIRLADAGPSSRWVTASTTMEMLGKVLTSPAHLGLAMLLRIAARTNVDNGIIVRIRAAHRPDGDRRPSVADGTPIREASHDAKRIEAQERTSRAIGSPG